MKMKITRISRRSLALILCVLMMFSTLMVGTITANAAISYWRIIGYHASGGTIDWKRTSATNKINGATGEITYDTNGSGEPIYFRAMCVENNNYYVHTAASDRNNIGVEAGIDYQLNWSTDIYNNWTDLDSAGNGQMVFVPTRRYVKFTMSSGNKLKITESGDPIGTLLDVLKGNKYMVYAGMPDNWGAKTVALHSSQCTSSFNQNISYSYPTSVYKKLPYSNSTQYNLSKFTITNGTYYVGKTDYAPREVAMTAGSTYILLSGTNSDTGFSLAYQYDYSGNRLYSYSATGTTKTVATTVTTPITVGNKLSVSSGSAGKSSIGEDNSIKYFIGSGTSPTSYTEYTISSGKLDTSSLATGTYTLKTVLTDGNIYVVGDTDTFKINPASSHVAPTFSSTGDTTKTAEINASVSLDSTATCTGSDTVSYSTVCTGVTGNSSAATTNATISGGATATPSFSANKAGVYTVVTTATNNADTSKTATKTYTITVDTKFNVSVAKGTHGADSMVTSVSAGALDSNKADISATAAYPSAVTFTNWTSANNKVTFANSSSSSTTITASGADTVTANFTPNTFRLVGDTGLTGSNWDVNDTDNVLTYNNNGTFSITKTVASANTYNFKVIKGNTYDNEWPSGYGVNKQVSVSAANSQVTITFNPSVVGADAITASATANTYKVTATSDYGVTLTFDGTSDTSVQKQVGGSAINISAPESCTYNNKPYVFKNWTSTNNKVTFANANSASTTVTAQAQDTIKAVYEQAYTVSFSSETGATLSGKSGSNNFTSGTAFKQGTSIEINATCNAGYTSTASSWSGAPTGATPTATKLTFTVGTSDLTISFTPTEASYTISVTAGTGGTVSPDSVTAHVVTPSGNATATASAGYTFHNWTVTSGGDNVTIISPNATSTKVNATSTGTIKANFTETMHTVTITNGSKNSASVGVATTATVSPKAADTGKRFKNWVVGSGVQLVNCSATDADITFKAKTSGEYTLEAIYEDIPTVTIYFKAKSWWTTASAVPYLHFWDSGCTGTEYPGNAGEPVFGESDVWSFTVPVDATFMFSRYNPAGDIYWDAKTDDLAYDGTHNLFTLSDTAKWYHEGEGSKDYAIGSWGTYTPKNGHKVTFGAEGNGSDGVTLSAVYGTGNTTFNSGASVPEGASVTITATFPQGYIPAPIPWVVTGASNSNGTFDESARTITTTFTVGSSDITAVVCSAIDVKTFEISEYTLSNTWLTPNSTTATGTAMVGIELPKARPNNNGAPLTKYTATIKLYKDGNTSSPLEFTSGDLFDNGTYDKDGKFKKKLTLENAIEIKNVPAGDYTTELFMEGYVGSEVVYTASLKDPAREITASDDPPRADVNARLSLVYDDYNVKDEDDICVEVMAGDTVTLIGSCANGNKAAGTQGKEGYIAENSADEYRYKYYYRIGSESATRQLIGSEIIDDSPNPKKTVTETTTTWTNNENVTTKVYFEVVIEAYKNGNKISRSDKEMTSARNGFIEATTITKTLVKTPRWAESGKVYVHTVGDDENDRNAWTAIEVVAKKGDADNDLLTIGDYNNAPDGYRVYLPETAKNNDGNFTVFNNTSSSITIAGISIQAGKISKVVPLKNSNIQFKDKTLTVYFSKAEENIFINVNSKTKKSDGSALTSSDQLIDALHYGFNHGGMNEDQAKEFKKNTIVTSPSVTMVNGATGTIDVKGDVAKQIKGRGNTTFKAHKKSYNLTLSEKLSVHGMTARKKYSLLANYQDPSLARNRFLYDLADSVGVRYATDSRFADVYMDGLYAGSFLLTEKYDDITNIKDPKFNENGSLVDPDNINFMIELACGTQGDDLEITPGNGSGILSVTIPDPEDFTEAQKQAVTNAIKTKYDAFYNAITNPNTTRAQLEELCDIDSIAKAYLIEELSKNYDSGVSSFYLCYENGKFYGAPVWDYDNSLGNNPTASVPQGISDYGKPTGWWCKYWKGNSQQYDGNLVYNATHNSIIMEAARKVWFGSSPSDNTSFVYHLRRFATGGNTTATLGANSGLQSASYYKAVLQGSADSNYTKWKVGNGNWTSGHGNLTKLSLDYDTFLGWVDYSTYSLKSNIDQDSDTFVNALTSSSKSYNETGINGQYDYTVDWMTSRTAWLSHQFLQRDSYYLVGSSFDWQPKPEYKMTRLSDGRYVYRNIPKANLMGDGGDGTKYFKLSNGSVYLGPSGDSDVSSSSATITGLVEQSTTAYYLSSDPFGNLVTNVDLYYDPGTKTITISAHVETTYQPATVSVTPAEDAPQFVSSGASARITATITSDAQYSENGGENQTYTGQYVFKLYNADTNDEVTSITGTSPAVFNINSFASGKYTFRYYVTATPLDSTAESEHSNITVVNYKYHTAKKDVTYYIDMHANKNLQPTINFNDGDRILTKVGNSTIYKGVHSTTYYYETDPSVPKAMSTKIVTITTGTGSSAKALSTKSVVSTKAITTKEVWLEAKEDIATATPSQAGTTAAGATSQSVTPTARRIYVSRGAFASGDTIYVYYWNVNDTTMSSWPGTPATQIGSSGTYYVDIDPSADTIIINNGDGGGKQTSDCSLGSNNSFYPKSNDGGYVAEPWEFQSSSPISITQYTKTLEVGSTDTTKNIQPVAHNGLTYTYTVANTNVATVDSSGNVTPKTSGEGLTTTVTITPTGSNGDTGTAVTTTITVVKESAGSTSNAYAIMSYMSNTSTFKAVNGTIGDVTTSLSGSQYPSALGLGTDTPGIVTRSESGAVSVQYAVADGDVTTYPGTPVLVVSAPSTGNANTTFLRWSKNNTPYGDSNATLSYSLIGQGKDELIATYSVNSIKLRITYNFVDFDTSDGNYEYDADKQTTPASYTTTIDAADAVRTNTTTLRNEVETAAPDIKSNYFDYSLGTVGSITGPDSEGVYSVEATMNNTVHPYTVMVGSTTVGSNYHFQEEITLDATKYLTGTADKGYIWKNSESGEYVSNKDKYQLRVTSDLALVVSKATGSAAERLEGKSVIKASYSEIEVINGKQYLGQNFYIQNFYTENGPVYDQNGGLVSNATNKQFVGAGVLFYLHSTRAGAPAKSQVKTFINNVPEGGMKNAIAAEAATVSTAKTAQGTSTNGFNYSFINYAEDHENAPTNDVLRYSQVQGCYNYFFDALMQYSPTYQNYEYRVYSYYVYTYVLNGTTYTVYSVCDNVASAKVYKPM